MIELENELRIPEKDLLWASKMTISPPKQQILNFLRFLQCLLCAYMPIFSFSFSGGYITEYMRLFMGPRVSLRRLGIGKKMAKTGQK